MQYVYILQSTKDKHLYVGCTNNLQSRVKLHNSGKVHSTMKRKPLDLVHYEAFIDKRDAFQREQWLKTGWGRNQVKKLLKHHLESLGG